MAEKTRCEECNRNFPNVNALVMHNAAKHPVNENGGKKSMNNKTKLFFIILIGALLLMGFFAFEKTPITANSIQEPSDISSNSDSEAQKITLGMKNYNYYPNTITVREGENVEIILDSSIRGCYRSFSIPKLGVSKYSSSPAETIKFASNQKGTFKFQCSMGMGTGTIIVE